MHAGNQHRPCTTPTSHPWNEACRRDPSQTVWVSCIQQTKPRDRRGRHPQHRRANGNITVALPNVSVTLVYTPPKSLFLHSELPDRCKHISIGDFKAHSTWWGYAVNNHDGEEVETWLESKHLTLIHAPNFLNVSTAPGGNEDITQTLSV